MDSCFVFFFFFQAEDGIRDVAVTGVQTCALPISLTQLLHHVIAVGDHLAHQAGRGRGGAQRRAIVLAEPDVVRILGRADGADLHVGSSMRSSLSPTRMRDRCRSGMSPRAANAIPFRLPSSRTTKSASSERTTACWALIDGS